METVLVAVVGMVGDIFEDTTVDVVEVLEAELRETTVEGTIVVGTIVHAGLGLESVVVVATDEGLDTVVVLGVNGCIGPEETGECNVVGTATDEGVVAVAEVGAAVEMLCKVLGTFEECSTEVDGMVLAGVIISGWIVLEVQTSNLSASVLGCTLTGLFGLFDLD